MNLDNKEQGYKFSRLWLNRHLASLSKRDLEELDKRFELISDRYLKVWKYPSVEVSTDEESEEINIFDAEDPTNKKLEYAIFFDQKLEVKNTSELFAEVNKTLFELNPQSYFASDLGEKLNLTKDKNKCRSALSLNETYFIEQHLSSKEKFARIMQALTLMGLPDELFIKYASEEEIY